MTNAMLKAEGAIHGASKKPFDFDALTQGWLIG
jgi:hypothetical protein